MTNQDINNKLNSIMLLRLERTQLNKLLSEMFGTEVEVQEYEREECVKNDIPELDDQFLFSVENDEANLYLDIDLYYIKDNAGRYFITEHNFGRQ